MNIQSQKKIVLLGMMSKMPVAGVVRQYLHYLIGFKRLGFDVYYVESHAMMPTIFMEHKQDDPNIKAAQFIADVMKRCDMSDRWAFHAIHDNGGCYGMTELQLKELYASADLIINMHGGTMPLPEHITTGRLVYLETDPVACQIELHNNVQQTIDFMDAHCAYFTFAENYGNPDCRLPVFERYKFIPTRQPVLCDLWQCQDSNNGSAMAFTTIGNWRQQWREVTFLGEVYHWSKHFEFIKYIDLPRYTPQPFELALSSFEEADKQLLEEKGWRVCRSMDFSMDVNAYRAYIQHSRAEFTVAKDQNVRLRTGWFSDRSATYLAAGRPVITQETGFSNALPTGTGLFSFSTMEGILLGVEAINLDYHKQCRMAKEVARTYFDYDVVLPHMTTHLDL